MAEKIVVAGAGSNDLAGGLASRLHCKLLVPDVTVFPDGESKLSIPSLPNGKDVIVIQRLFPQQDKRLVELTFLMHKLKENGNRITLVAPYLAYARQNREFLSGEIVSVKVVADIFRLLGVRRLLVVDAHNVESLMHFPMPTSNCMPERILASYVSSKLDLKDPVVAAPDEGSIARAAEFADLIGTDSFSFHKTRDKRTGEVRTRDKKVDLGGRDAVIVDDMISTGRTVINCARLLKKHGARRITAVCTHALLVDGAAQQIKRAGIERVISTNTVLSRHSVVDVSPLLAKSFGGA